MTGNGTAGYVQQPSPTSGSAATVATSATTTTTTSNQTAAAATPTVAAGSGVGDVGLMQPPRNPAPSTHHKKGAVPATGISSGAVSTLSASVDGNNITGSTGRRRGTANNASSSVAAVVAAVAGGGAGPGPPSVVSG